MLRGLNEILAMTRDLGNGDAKAPHTPRVVQSALSENSNEAFDS